MAWPEITLQSWAQFVAAVSKLPVPPAGKSAYIFRGQEDSKWGLDTSLQRRLPVGTTVEHALDMEEKFFREFRIDALQYGFKDAAFSQAPRFHWWAWMQHFHTPTRLLDWTDCPYGAAYFAAVDNQDADGAIWLVHAADVCAPIVRAFGMKQRKSERLYLDPNAEPWLEIWWPELRPPRVVAQQGIFTVCRHVLGDHDAIIDAICAPIRAKSGSLETYRKVILPKHLKPEFLGKLETMNITAASLFPETGQARYAEGTPQLASLFGDKPVELSV